jgi:UDP-glucose 4-epimerase
MKKVLVTGGAGFIGSHLAEGLAGRGWQVTILDDLSTGKRENIAAVLKQDRVKFVEGSILDVPLLQKLTRNIDYVFHQAAIPSVSRSMDNPLASHEANVTGTLNVLVTARDTGVKKVIYASSCAVYGDTTALPIGEEISPSPQSPYAVTKLAGEYYCQVFEKAYGLATICLRYFNIYGPRQDPDGEYAAVIPRFLKRASEGKSPIIYGDGEQTRDFTFVIDTVEANILAAESQACGIFNIGTGISSSVNELANIILDITGSKVGPIYEEPRAGDIRYSYADISKSKTFGYEPKYSLEEGLRQTFEKSER